MERWTEWEIYVRRRLERWGDVFALHRDCEYLGHQSKNMLQVLIEHRGEMPARATGFKPLEVDPLALQVEQAVTDLSQVNVACACVIRAMYCGRGRRGVERLEEARALLSKATGVKRLSRSQYYHLHEGGVRYVSEWMEREARRA